MERTADLPDVTLESLGIRTEGGKPAAWPAVWRIVNKADSPVHVLSCWLPHDKFNSERRRFQPPLELQPFGTLELEIMVTCGEAPGTSFDAAFVILEIESQEPESQDIESQETESQETESNEIGPERSLWRVFARHVVTVDEKGVPHAVCKSVTIQPVASSDSSGN